MSQPDSIRVSTADSRSPSRNPGVGRARQASTTSHSVLNNFTSMTIQPVCPEDVPEVFA